MGNLLGAIGASKNGKVTSLGWEIFSDILDLVNPVPDLPLEIFLKFMSKVVSTSVELVLIRQGKIFLTWRDDKFFMGWHFPGGYIAPGETLIQTCQRIVDRETPGVRITGVRVIDGVNHPNSRRFHDFSALILAEFGGEPQSGQWFDDKPTMLIDYHEPFWPIIKQYL